MQKKLSVVVVTYNHEKYIAHCLNSILSQSFSEFELIIVDDGSTDKTRETIQQFNDPRLLYHYQENMGTSGASNTALALTKTEYISLMSGDDMMYEGRLEQQYAYFLNHPEATIIFGQCAVIDEENHVLPSHPIQTAFESVKISDRYQLFNHFFFHGNCLNAITCMLRRSVFYKVGAFQFASLQTQDYMLWFEWLKHSEIILLDNTFAYYRVRNNNQNLSSEKNNTRTMLEHVFILENILDNVDMPFFKRAFATELKHPSFSSLAAFELEKAFVYLKHRKESVQTVGLKKLFFLLQNEEIRNVFLNQYKISFKEYYTWMAKIYPYNDTENSKHKKLYTSLKKIIAQRFPVIISIKKFMVRKLLKR